MYWNGWLYWNADDYHTLWCNSPGVSRIQLTQFLGAKVNFGNFKFAMNSTKSSTQTRGWHFRMKETAKNKRFPFENCLIIYILSGKMYMRRGNLWFSFLLCGTNDESGNINNEIGGKENKYSKEKQVNKNNPFINFSPKWWLHIQFDFHFALCTYKPKQTKPPSIFHFYDSCWLMNGRTWRWEKRGWKSPGIVILLIWFLVFNEIKFEKFSPLSPWCKKKTFLIKWIEAFVLLNFF